MMKHEFEALAKREVTEEQYRAIEILYMSSTMNKQDFVKSIKGMLKAITEPEKEKNIKKMCVRNRSGYRKTPNRCYFYIEYVELVDVDIRTGKYIVKALEDDDLKKLKRDGHDLNYDVDFDIDYMNCIDIDGNEIKLAA